LPTLHEDSEFSYPAVELNKPIPLTHDALMATKNVRMNVESRPVGGLYPRWVIVIECLWKIAWSISFFLMFSFNFCLHFYLIGMPLWSLFQFTYDFVFFFGFRFFFFAFIYGVVVECPTTHITPCTQPAITRRTIPFHARIPRYPLMLIRTTLAHWPMVLCKNFEWMFLHF
jgi:hypothetical protein